MLNKLDKIGLRLKIELAAASAIGTIGLLVGIQITNPSGFQKHALTALGSATASAVAFGVVSALTSPVGSLRLEVGKLQSELRAKQVKLDKEYVDAQNLLARISEFEAAGTAHSFEKIELQDKLQKEIDQAKKSASEWQTSAHNAHEVVTQLRAKVDELQSEIEALQVKLEDEQATFEKRLSEEVHRRAKAKANQVAQKLYGNYEKNLSEQEQAAKEACELEIAKHQARIDELKREYEELQAKVANFGAEKDDLVTVFEDLTKNRLPDIAEHFNGILADNDLIIQKTLEDLRNANARLQAPRFFTAETSVDIRGNRIIQHFYQYDIVLDAVESVSLPHGWRLRFKCDRTGDFTKLTEEEFDKRTSEPGLMGLSYTKLDFSLDTRNFIVSVELVDTPQIAAQAAQTTIAPGQAVSVSEAVEAVSSGSNTSENAFRSLGCFPASEFENVIRDRFVPRVRVVAGSTGGKSPLMELISVAIAKLNQAELWLLNPLPGSPKDWFSVPGLIAPGSNPTTQQIAWMEAAHKELTKRRANLEAGKKFIMVMADEVNALSREYENLGTVLKDFYQLSDHAQMGIITAGQGANVSGVSGGAKKNNAGKLMEEDFQNATQVFTSQSAKVWLTKNNKALLPTLAELEKLCTELNKAEGLSARPKPGTKVVDRNAYRVALVVSPAADEPFFIQIPPYSFYADKLDGVSFPSGATITAPYQNQVALGLVLDPMECPSCGSHNTKQERGLAKEIKRKCNDCGSFYKVPKTDAIAP